MLVRGAGETGHGSVPGSGGALRCGGAVVVDVVVVAVVVVVDVDGPGAASTVGAITNETSSATAPAPMRIART